MEEPAVTVVSRDGVSVVAVTGPMTIGRVRELKGGLLQALELGQPVELSVAGVTEVDVAGLQLVCGAHRSLAARGRALSVVGCESEAVAPVAELCGMMRHMGCALDAGGECVWKREG